MYTIHKNSSPHGSKVPYSPQLRVNYGSKLCKPAYKLQLRASAKWLIILQFVHNGVAYFIKKCIKNSKHVCPYFTLIYFLKRLSSSLMVIFSPDLIKTDGCLLKAMTTNSVHMLLKADRNSNTSHIHNLHSPTFIYKYCGRIFLDCSQLINLRYLWLVI